MTEWQYEIDSRTWNEFMTFGRCRRKQRGTCLRRARFIDGQSEKYVPDLMMPCLKSDLRSKRSFLSPFLSIPSPSRDSTTSPSFPHFYNGSRPSFSSNNFTRRF
jgi:hypothetical protein